MTKTNRILIGSLILISILIVTSLIFACYKLYNLNKLSSMSFEDMMNFTTKNTPKANISVAIIEGDNIKVSVYGEISQIKSSNHTVYEIGSITKTFTASLISKAIVEGKVNLNDSIDKYIELKSSSSYPTIKALLTHTSGFKNYYFNNQMMSNFFHNRNDYYSINDEDIIKQIEKEANKNNNTTFLYSNFGMSILGLVLENVYNEPYINLVNKYTADTIGLNETRVLDKNILNETYKNFWEWKFNDSYIAAGGLTSSLDDMVKYAQLQLSTDAPIEIKQTHDILENINSNSKVNKKMNIQMDGIGMAWIYDKKNDIFWHNGGTDNYNSYIGLDLKNNKAVVILSNLPPKYRIPATVMGAELLTK